jgi:hydroxymethylbilane synthase
VDVSLPAIGQGSLGLEGRKDDTLVRDLVAQFEHRPTRIAVTAERALLAGLEGGCQVPIAGYATLQGDMLTLDGLVASLDGKRYIRQVVSGPAGEAESIGRRVAEQLLDGGAHPILQEIYGAA